MKRSILNSTVLIVALGTATAGAENGVLITQKVTTGGSESTNQVHITKTRMRTEITDAGGGARQAVVFDGDRQVMYLINEGRKRYSEITKADLDRLAGQMQDMMAKVPPEMRAKVEAMMKGRGMAAGGAAKTEYRRAGTDKAGKWICDKYDGFQEGQKISEICTVAPGALGLTPADFVVTRQFASFFEKLMPQVASQVIALGETQEQGFSGLPVKSSSTIAGRTTTSELTDVSRQSFDDALFAPPAGYQKEASPFGAGRGR